MVFHYEAGVQGRAGCARAILAMSLLSGIACCAATPVVALLGYSLGPLPLLIAAGLAMAGAAALPLGMLSLVWRGTEVDPERMELRTWWRLVPLPRRVTRLPLTDLQAVEVLDEGSVRYPRYTVRLVGTERYPLGSYARRLPAEASADELAAALSLPRG